MQTMMKAEELAEALGVPIRTIYQWRSRGGGPVGYRVGRFIRYRAEDVDAWLEAQRDKPRSAA